MMFGKRAVTPQRKYGETWEECFHRTCVEDAPEWIAERALHIRDDRLRMHARHSRAPFPEVKACKVCDKGITSWKKMAHVMYSGDPFASRATVLLDYIEPEFFRPGAGTWGGKPSW